MNKLSILLKKRISETLSSLSIPLKDFSLTPTKNLQFGDLSTNIALVISKDLKKKPMDIGQKILDSLSMNSIEDVEDITLTNPGFINFKIKHNFFQRQIHIIIKQNKNYGKGNYGDGKTANVEFVSANPTGPLTIGHGRNAILGDTVSNILEWQGFTVTREYYFNDAGRQMRKLGESVEARYDQLSGNTFSFPEDGYEGDYIKEIARIILKKELGQESFNQIADLSEPVAAASIAQVHFANIKSDKGKKEVAIKILRPNIMR